MLDGATESRVRMVLAVVLTGFVCSSCQATNDWLRGRKTAEATEVTESQANTGSPHVSEMYRLVNGDPATQAEIYADAQAAAQLTPDPSTRLRFALVLATPGHSASNPAEAQSLLRDLLSNSALMDQSEIEIATVHLRDVEARIGLDSEMQRLRSANTRAASTEEQAIAQRIATVEAENRRLRQSLSEAEQKLEAITSIEREIREQNGD